MTAEAGRNPRLGYQFAALNAVISGFAVFLNNLGVRMFADSTLYTALKNGVVAVAVMQPFLVSRTRREELARLTRGQWSLLVLIALVAGSVAYGVDFRGRQISTATTAAVIGHTQFLIVAVLAAILLGERFPRTIPLALLVLAAGLTLGARIHDVRVDAGVPLLAASTLLFAAGAVLIKVALRTVSIATVVAGLHHASATGVTAVAVLAICVLGHPEEGRQPSASVSREAGERLRNAVQRAAGRRVPRQLARQTPAHVRHEKADPDFLQG